MTNSEREAEPFPRCNRHQDDPADHPCGMCREAREYRDEWLRNRARNDGQQRSADARERAQLQRAEIARCHLCDADGYLVIGVGVCHHDPEAGERTRRGMQLIRAAMAASAQREDED